MNVALYHASGNRWAMTERGRGSLARDEHRIAIGPSAMHWNDDALSIEIDECTAPLPSRVRGRVRVSTPAPLRDVYALDADARHHWRPIAPIAEIEVRMETPRISWRGQAYVDSNWGDEPLEEAFRGWDWSRAQRGYEAIVHYDVTTHSGARHSIALRFDASGEARAIQSAPEHRLQTTFWGLGRRLRCADSPTLVQTLEDTPFYARSWLRSCGDAEIVHESLSLDRLRLPIVRAMLPFRMPRLVGR